MLLSLHISNYALIDHLDLDLTPGFGVITGETGAGKSIILGALGLLQGRRADPKALKAGAAKCIVEGVFSTEGLDVDRLLEQADIDFDPEDAQIVVRREITAAGKSRTFINDTPTNLSVLREVSDRLIDIHSQHQNLLLAHETFLLDTLDVITGEPEVRGSYDKAYRDFVTAERRLRQLREEAQRNSADQDYLTYQLAQIDDAELDEDEQDALEEESRTLSHAEEIKSALYHAGGVLQSDESDVSSALRTAAAALDSIAKFLPEAEALSERLTSARIEVDDILSDVERAADSVDYNPERLAYVDDRLSNIYRLQKKHQVDSIAELLALAEDLRNRLSAIDNADELLAQAERDCKSTRTALRSAARQLTAIRHAAAKEVEDALIETLHHLGMPSVRLCFEFDERARPDASGNDTLRFLFSANKNVPPQDVAQTASGGEIARLMLALKSLIARKRQLPTIIFDEIDAGVSGTMAERMGQIMQRMGEHAQVLCITHLPQIAALGASHFLVRKEEDEHGTTSRIAPLDAEERVQELAHMLSGANLTEAAMANARALLNS